MAAYDSESPIVNIINNDFQSPEFKRYLNLTSTLDQKRSLVQNALLDKGIKLDGAKEALYKPNDGDSGLISYDNGQTWEHVQADENGSKENTRLFSAIQDFDTADLQSDVDASRNKRERQYAFVRQVTGKANPDEEDFRRVDEWHSIESYKRLLDPTHQTESYNPDYNYSYDKHSALINGQVVDITNAPVKVYARKMGTGFYGRDLTELLVHDGEKFHSVTTDMSQDPSLNTGFDIFKAIDTPKNRERVNRADFSEQELNDLRDSDGYLGEAVDLLQASTVKALKSSAQGIEYLADRAYDGVANAIGSVFGESKTASRLRELATERNQKAWDESIAKTDTEYGVKYSTREEQNKQSQEFHNEVLKAFDNYKDLGSFTSQVGSALWDRVSKGGIHFIADNLGSTAVMLAEAAAVSAAASTAAPALAGVAGIGGVTSFMATHKDFSRAVIGGFSSASMNIPDYIKTYKENHNGKDPSMSEVMAATALFTVSGALDTAIDFGVMKGTVLTNKVFSPITQMMQKAAPDLVHNAGSTSILRTMLKTAMSMGKEGITEFPQEGFDQAIQSMMSDAKFDLKNPSTWDFKKYAPDILEAASLGMASGVASGPIIGNRVTGTLLGGGATLAGVAAGKTAEAAINTAYAVTNKIGLTDRENKLLNKIVTSTNPNADENTSTAYKQEVLDKFGSATKAYKTFMQDRKAFNDKMAGITSEAVAAITAETKIEEKVVPVATSTEVTPESKTEPTTVTEAVSEVQNLDANDEVGKVQQVLHNAAKALQLDKGISKVRSELKAAIDNASETSPVFVIDLETTTHTNGKENASISANKIGQIGIAKVTSPTADPEVSSVVVNGIDVLNELAADGSKSFKELYAATPDSDKQDIKTALKTLVKTLTGLEPTEANASKIQDMSVTVVGHNFANFDSPIIRQAALQNGIPLPQMKIYDTLNLSRVTNPSRSVKGSHTLENLSKALGLDTTKEHTADADVKNNLAVAKSLANVIDDTDSKQDIAKVLEALNDLRTQPAEVVKKAYSYLASLSSLANDEVSKSRIDLLKQYYRALTHSDPVATKQAMDAIVQALNPDAKPKSNGTKERITSSKAFVEFTKLLANRDKITNINDLEERLTEQLNVVVHDILEQVFAKSSRYTLSIQHNYSSNALASYNTKDKIVTAYTENISKALAHSIATGMTNEANGYDKYVRELCSGKNPYSALIHCIAVPILHENTHGIFNDKIMSLAGTFDSKRKLTKKLALSIINKLGNKAVYDITYHILTSPVYLNSSSFVEAHNRGENLKQLQERAKKIIFANDDATAMFVDEVLAYYISHYHVSGINDEGHVVQTQSAKSLDTSIINNIENFLKTIYTGLYNMIGEAVYRIFGRDIPVKTTFSDKELYNFLDAVATYASYGNTAETTKVDASNIRYSANIDTSSIKDITEFIQQSFAESQIEIDQSSLSKTRAEDIFDTTFKADTDENGDNKKSGLLAQVNKLAQEHLEKLANFKFGETVITKDVTKQLFDPNTELGKSFTAWKSSNAVKKFIEKAKKAYSTGHQELSALVQDENTLSLILFLSDAWFTDPKTVAMFGNKINDYQLESLFDIRDKDEIAKSEARTFLQQNGLPVDVLTSQLGQYLTQTLGIVPDRSDDKEAFALERLQKSLGAMCTEFLSFAEVLSEPVEVTQKALGFETQTRIIDETPVDYTNTFQQYINSFYAGQGENGSVSFIRFNPNAEKRAKAYRTHIQNLVDGCNLSYVFRKSPRTSKEGFIAPNYVHNTNGVSKVNAEQKKEMDRLSKVGFKFNTRAMDILKQYRDRIIESGIMGNTPISKLKDLTFDQKQSALGKLQSTIRDLSMTLAAYDQQTALTTQGKFDGFYYDYMVTANGRMMVSNNTVNIQSDKQTNRYLQYSSTSNYSVNPKKNSKDYMYQAVAIAQAFDTYGDKKHVQKFYDTLSKLSSSELNRLVDLMLTDKEAFTKAMKNLTGVDVNVESMGKSLMAFVHLLDRQDAIAAGKTSFQSSIKIENDATVSGTAIRLLQVPVAKILKQFGRALGIVKDKSDLRNIAQGKAGAIDDYQDLYNAIGADAQEALSKIDSSNSSWLNRNYPELNEMFITLKPILSGKDFKVRDLIKKFGVVFFYGGGRNSASTAIVESVIDKVFSTAMPLLRSGNVRVSVADNGYITLNAPSANVDEQNVLYTLQNIVNNVAFTSITTHTARNNNTYNLKEAIKNHIKDGQAAEEIYKFFTNNSLKNINMQIHVPAKWERTGSNKLMPVTDSETGETVSVSKKISLYEYIGQSIQKTYGKALFEVFDSTFKSHRVFNTYLSAMFANAQNMYIQAFNIAMRKIPKDSDGNYNLTFKDYRNLINTLKPMMPAISMFYSIQGEDINSEDLMFNILKLDKTHFTNDNVIKIKQKDIEGNIRDLVASLGVFKTTGLAAAVLPIHNIDGSVMLSTQRKHKGILSIFDALVGTPEQVDNATTDYDKNLLAVNREHDLFAATLSMFSSVSESFDQFLKDNNAEIETHIPTGIYDLSRTATPNTKVKKDLQVSSELISINGVTDTDFLALPTSLYDTKNATRQPLTRAELIEMASKIGEEISQARQEFYNEGSSPVVENMSNLFFDAEGTNAEVTEEPVQDTVRAFVPFSAISGTQKAVAQSIGEGFRDILTKADKAAVPLINSLMYAARNMITTDDYITQHEIITWATSDSFKRGALNSTTKLAKLAWAWMRLPANVTSKKRVKVMLNKASREAFNGAIHNFWVQYGREFFKRDNWSRQLEEIQALKKKLEAIIEREVNISKNYNESLFTSADGKVISEDEKIHLTKGLLLTDAQSLLHGDSSINTAKLLSILRNKDERTEYKNQLIQQLPAELQGYLTTYGKLLAHYMVTREANILVNVDTNASSIMSSLQTSGNNKLATAYRNLNANQRTIITSVLDKIITLEAMDNTDESVLNSVANLNVADLNGAVTEFLDQHTVLVNHSRQRGVRAHQGKGYIKTITDSSVAVETDLVDEETVKRRARAGWVLVESSPLRESANIQIGQYVQDYAVQRHLEGMSLSFIGAERVTKSLQAGSFTEQQIENLKNRVPVRYNKCKEALDKGASVETIIKLGGTHLYRDDQGYVALAPVSYTDMERLGKQDFNAFEITARMQAAHTAQEGGKENNTKLFDFLREAAKKSDVSKIGDDDEFYDRMGHKWIAISSNEDFTKNPEVREAFNRLPAEIKHEINQSLSEVFAGNAEPLMVREDWVLDVFGSKTLSLADTNWSQLDPKLNNIIRRIEYGCRFVASGAKNNIVLLMPKVAFGNICSNVFYHTLVHGIDPITAAKKQWDMVKLLQEYQAIAKKQEELKFKLKSLSSTNTQRVSKAIDTLQKQLEAPKYHTIHTLIEHGMFTTIIEDVNISDLENTGAIQKAINNSKLANKTPEVVKKGLRQLYMTPGTKVYDAMFKITQYSDFAARCVEYELSMEELEKDIATKKLTGEAADKYRKEHEQVIFYDARDAFINYDKPHHSYLQYLNDMGILMFTKYLFRSQKVIMNALRKHPATALLITLAQEGTVDFEDPIDSHWLHKAVTYPTSNIHNPISSFVSTVVPMPIQYALGWHNITPSAFQ